MNNYLMLAISMSFNLFGGIIKKSLNDKYENNMFSYQLYNAVVSISSAVVLFFIADNLKVSLFTIMLALVFGLITLLQQISNLFALEKGPFSYTTVIISLSTLIPTLSGHFIWKESISALQYIGIAFLIISLILSADFHNKSKKSSVQWIIFSLTAFICTGLIGVMQKWHQNSAYKNELDGFLVIAFAFSFICSTIYSLILYKKRNSGDNTKKSTLSLLPIFLMLISGIFVAINNKFNLYLSGAMDSAVFFPLVNGGGLILSTLSALIIFREKLKLLQLIGLISGIISVLLLCFS